MDLGLWIETNQKHLVNSIDKIEMILKRFIVSSQTKTKNSNKKKIDGQEKYTEYTPEFYSQDSSDFEGKELVTPQQSQQETPPALETICKLFGLSIFERSVLLLCAAVELKNEISDLCAKAHGDPNSSYPTFGLALAALPNPHWSALIPTAPLRRFRLITISEYSHTPVAKCPIKIEERVLHYLAGLSYIDKQLWAMMMRPVRVNAPIPESQQQLVEEILDISPKKVYDGNNYYHFVAAPDPKYNELPDISCIHLLGESDEFTKQIIARSVCRKLGMDLWQISAEFIPLKTEELETFSTLWCRESSLQGCGLYISAEDIVDPGTRKILSKLVTSGNLPGPLFLCTKEHWPSLDPLHSISIAIPKPIKSEQYKIWRECMEAEGVSSTAISDLELPKIVGHYDFNTSDIILAIKETLLSKKSLGNNSRSSRNSSPPLSSVSSTLWSSCRKVAAQHKMGELAIKIVPKATLDDMVLPANQKQLLQNIAIHVKNRTKVYEDWGFEAKSGGRGLGITTLFAGESGTGKTMAAEALANELDLDLFRIDLSMIVSKYIGETEKNLRKAIEVSEKRSAILFFDEADALFGKRSEVKDSHDRYANIEVSYLLQKMEEYTGLAILATNMKTSLDPAFIRRIRFIVKFQFPDEGSRAEIWRRIFPKLTPIRNLDINSLAKLNITGGNIRSIALNATFLAAEEDVAVSMTHVKEAIKMEYYKLERPLPHGELGGW